MVDLCVDSGEVEICINTEKSSSYALFQSRHKAYK